MLNLELICQHPDVVRIALQKRRDTPNIDNILSLAEQRRALVTRKDGLFSELKKWNERVRATPVPQRRELNDQIKRIKEDIRKIELQISEVETHLQFHLVRLPNIPHASVKSIGESEEVHRWGEPLSFFFEPAPHWELGEQLSLLDIEMGVRIAGSRFVALKGFGARLERALISFMLDIHTREHGYLEIMPPQLVKRALVSASGHLPKYEDQMYASDDLYLNPTAEVPLLGLHSDSILREEELPLRYVAWTTAYRREAGSASRQNRGLLRLHQFNKIELFQYVAAKQSYLILPEILQHAERILQLLELPYRVVALDASQLPFAAAMTFDIEVWMPAAKEYVEVSSVSNCEEFQSRRAKTKYRLANSTRTDYVHTLNGSGLAVGRTMAAILETYQQADGSVIVPKVLRPYMGVSVLTAPEK